MSALELELSLYRDLMYFCLVGFAQGTLNTFLPSVLPQLAEIRGVLALVMNNWEFIQSLTSIKGATMSLKNKGCIYSKEDMFKGYVYSKIISHIFRKNIDGGCITSLPL